ncbi:hypothetical protein I5Q49_10030 [Pseudomonas carnis]|uniref:hypothetical protein n=1 Tax=Pseudomonas TaxID=286 RepID=UPI0018D8B414|nr:MULTISPECIES: hypothetical protein [Pseudomonas]MBH3465183.1 hypothetical protein [Pseudomonas carnis]
MTTKLFFLCVAAVLLAACGDAFAPASRTVCISGYNQNERKIHMFWLDDESKAGCWGNPPGRDVDQIYGGGGKFNCGCRVTAGKQVSLAWDFARSRKEVEAGMPKKEFFTQVTIPQPESSTSRYFRAYFMKDGTAQLQWVDSMGAPELVPPEGAE